MARHDAWTHTHSLWMHEEVARMQATYNRASGFVNPVDLVTNELPNSDVERYTQMIGGSFAEGRAEIFATDENIEDDEVDDRPGEALFVARGRAIAELEGRLSIMKGVGEREEEWDEVSYFKVKKNGAELKFIICDQEQVVNGSERVPGAHQR